MIECSIKLRLRLEFLVFEIEVFVLNTRIVHQIKYFLRFDDIPSFSISETH